MATDRVRSADHEATRDRLIDVTIELLKQHGNHALRLADVAKESGVAVSTIYAHFRDRTDLVAAARLLQFKAHADWALDRVNFAAEPALTSETFTEASMWPSLLDPDEPEGCERRWDRIEAIADSRHIPQLAGQIRDLQATFNERATEIISQAQDLGLVDPTLDASAVAMISQVLRLGLAQWDISGDTKPDQEAWADVIGRVFGVLMPEGIPPVD